MMTRNDKPLWMTAAVEASLKNIARLERCDNPDVECWDRTGTLELRGMVTSVRTIDGRAGGYRHILTVAGRDMLAMLRHE